MPCASTCALRTGARGGREGRDGEEGGGSGPRSLALLGPVRGPVRPPLAAHGGRRPSSRSRSPPSAPAVASPAPRRPVGDPLSRPAVSFRSVSLGGGARPFPRRGKGSAPRRRPAVAPGRSRLRARRVSSRRRFPPSAFPPPTPVRVPSYRVPARRFKDPGGVASPSPGVGGTEGPAGGRRGGSLGLPFPRRHAAVAGSGSPPWAPVGLASACPVRRCVVGRGPRVCRSRPAS